MQVANTVMSNKDKTWVVSVNWRIAMDSYSARNKCGKKKKTKIQCESVDFLLDR